MPNRTASRNARSRRQESYRVPLGYQVRLAHKKTGHPWSDARPSFSSPASF
jgi:hypothetical protein